jgi:hypothetical protein
VIVSHLETASIRADAVIADLDDNSMHYEVTPQFTTKVGSCLLCHLIDDNFIDCQGSCVPRGACGTTATVYDYCSDRSTSRDFSIAPPGSMIDWRSVTLGPISAVPVHLDRQIQIIVSDKEGNSDSCVAKVRIRAPRLAFSATSVLGSVIEGS